MKAVRVVLVLSGLAVLILGAVIMLDTVKLIKILGLLSWLVAAIIIHDGIIAPGVFAVDLIMRKVVGRRIPSAVLAIVQSGIVVGSVFTLIVVPEILAQRFAHVTSSLLNADYLARLGILWLVIAVITAAAVLGYLAIRRRQKVRPALSQR